MAGRIPDRWLQYKSCGKVIEGTRIICFKVPLKRAVQVKHVEENNIWDITQLLLRIPNIGAVLDLTNTARYYNPKNFEAVGVLHKKILIPGRAIPPESKVTEFMNALDGFLEENNKCLVGVHCTHGLNRTGYMVCRYMRDRLGVPAAEAIRLSTGYESDREEWRSSRSQFSTTAFDSLARPTKMAMALTLRKPQRLDPAPQYYRLSSEPKPKLTPLPFRPNNFLQRAPRLPRPSPEIKRNLSTDHRKYTSLQSLELPKKLSEPKKNSNLSNRITGLTNKLRDLGVASNTIGRFKAQSHGDVANLKPVLKNNVQDGAKRSVVRTCSVEPPKKVTFSAFATVQVV